jgi:hypothetical protein
MLPLLPLSRLANDGGSTSENICNGFENGRETGFENSAIWEQWEASMVVEEDQIEVLDAHSPFNLSAIGIFQQTSVIPEIDRPDQVPDFVYQEEQAPSRGSIRNIPRDILTETYPRGVEGVSKSSSGAYTHYFETPEGSSSWPQSIPTCALSPVIAFLGDNPAKNLGAGPDSTAIESRITSPAFSPLPTGQQKSKTKRRRKSQQAPFMSVTLSQGSSATFGSSNLSQTVSHKGTEKKYRERLNNEFSELLNALPAEQVSATVGDEFGLELSKFETLQLAITHIEMLERQQKDLKQESLVLRGQVGLLKDLLGLPMK